MREFDGGKSYSSFTVKQKNKRLNQIIKSSSLERERCTPTTKTEQKTNYGLIGEEEKMKVRRQH